MATAHGCGWKLLHYDPASSLDWLMNEWAPEVIVIGPELGKEAVQRLSSCILVSVTVNRSAERIASVCLDEEGIAALAFEHLWATGLRHVTTFRFDESAFAIAREVAFREQARAVGATSVPSWGDERFTPEQRGERPVALIDWLRSLPTPYGVFAMTDGWGRDLARYSREVGLRIPEVLALIGVDNDVLECNLVSPPLSSVAIPWHEVGRSAATLVRLACNRQPINGRRIVISPIAVTARRSTEFLAVDDTLVVAAVNWIRANAHQRRSGFSSASLLNVAVRREVGLPPGTYRRRAKGQSHTDDEE